LSFSDYTEKKLIDEVLGGVNYAPPATVYFALLTDSNTAAQRDAGTVTEVYQRAAVANNTTNFPAAAGVTALKSNAVDIGPTAFLSTGTTITATGSVTLTAVGVYDAATSGNLLLWFPLATAKTVANGDQFKVPASSMSGTLD
jgi:hypothetical protein